VHDDIIDRGDTRRGHLATQREYGLAKALVAGDFLFIKGFELAGKLDGTVVGITARACQRLAEGELLEIQCLGQRDLDLARYLRIIEGKTASVLEACGRIGAHLAGRDDLVDALGAYGHHLGMAFQITDDLLDLRGDPAVTGKPRGTDLRTGAPNAPVLLGMRNGARARLEAMLAQGLERQEDVDAAIEVILASGAMQDAERLAQEHGARAVEALAAVPEGPAKQALVDHVRALPRRGR
jgi:octaprenyl-diphosphate synthase